MMMRWRHHVSSHGSFLHSHHSYGRLDHYRGSQSGHSLLLAAALHHGLLAVMAMWHLDECGHRLLFGHHHDRFLRDHDHVLLEHRHHGHHLLLHLRHDHFLRLGLRLHDLLLLDHRLDNWLHSLLLLRWLDDVHVRLGGGARRLGGLDYLQRGLGLDRWLDHAQRLDRGGDGLDVESLHGLGNSLDVQRLNALRHRLDVERLHGRLWRRLYAVGLLLRQQARRVQADYRFLRPVLILPPLLDLQILLLQRFLHLRRGHCLGQGQSQQQKYETRVEIHFLLPFLDLFDLLERCSTVELWRFGAASRVFKGIRGRLGFEIARTQWSWLCGIPRMLRHHCWHRPLIRFTRCVKWMDAPSRDTIQTVPTSVALFSSCR